MFFDIIKDEWYSKSSLISLYKPMLDYLRNAKQLDGAMYEPIVLVVIIFHQLDLNRISHASLVPKFLTLSCDGKKN